MAPLWARLLRIPRSYLYAGILFFSSLGAYAANASTFDLFLLLVIGALGFMMRRYGLPVLPCIIGVILGPFAEQKLRQALQISNGDLGGLFEPISIVVYCIVGLLLLWPLVRRVLPRKTVPGVFQEAAHEIEEAHEHTGLTSAVSVERHVGDEVPRSRTPGN
jgi:putative tricarboxylic transport membrane protein